MLVVWGDGRTVTQLRTSAPFEPVLCFYRPSRSAVKDRGHRLVTVAVNLYYLRRPLSNSEVQYLLDMLESGANGVKVLEELNAILYTWALDVDHGKTDRTIREVMNQLDWLLVVRTAKGFHVYLNVLSDRASDIIRQVYRIEKRFGDPGHVKLAKVRMRMPTLAWGAIRVGGKYYPPDMYIVDERPEHAVDAGLEKWIREVIGLIRYYNEI